MFLFNKILMNIFGFIFLLRQFLIINFHHLASHILTVCNNHKVSLSTLDSSGRGFIITGPYFLQLQSFFVVVSGTESYPSR